MPTDGEDCLRGTFLSKAAGCVNHLVGQAICKAAALRPRLRIAGNWPAAKWDELMPWNWREDQQQIAEAA